jgi:hypothetical protein
LIQILELEEVMKGNHKNGEKQGVRKELKYCERCGGLWVRECGAGVVYCDNCAPEVADLPAPKKKAVRSKMPVRSHVMVDDYEVGIRNDEEMELEAVGGVA